MEPLALTPAQAEVDRPQTMPSRVPASASLIPGLAAHWTEDEMHEQTSSFGVGGRLGETFQVELVVGHAAAAVLVTL